MADPDKNILQKLGRLLLDLADWIVDTFGDPAIASEIQADIGLRTDSIATPSKVDPSVRGKLEDFFRKDNVDTAAFVETAVEINALIDTIWTFVEAAKSDGMDGWDVFWLVAKVWVADSLRVRNPAAFAMISLLGLIMEDDEVVPQLDLSIVKRLLNGDADSSDAAAVVQRLAELGGAALVLAEAAGSDVSKPATDGEALGKIDAALDATFGWDPEPGTPIQAMDAVSRALTVSFETGDLDPVVSLLTVSAENGGPGILISSGARLIIQHDTGNHIYTSDIGANGAFTLFFRLSTEDPGFRVIGSEGIPAFGILSERKKSDTPFVVLGPDDGTRFEIGRLTWGMDFGADRAGFRARLDDGKFVISLRSAGGFLSNLPGEDIEAKIDISMIGDTTHGVRFDGGSGLRVDLPVAASVFGVFTVHFLSIEIELEGDAPTVEVRGGFSLRLGAFTAVVDQIGVGIGSGEKDLDAGSLVHFLPPKGIGLVLDWGVVKGGGYLYIDPERGEYFGSLELKFATWSLKALALITDRRPDGSDGWSLLVFVYGQFHFHVAFGIFWNGIGGMIGLHHRADLDALQAGVRSGALDDILFPADPVADAPRIIARYRQLFPIEQDSLLFGPMLEFAFSQPPIVYVRLGLIFEVRNALGGGDTELSKVVIIGQILVQLPPKDLGVPAIVKLLVDITGAWDADTQRIWIRGSLRDSFVGIEGFAKLSLSGDLFVLQQFGDHPTFLLTAGGFHPEFTDLPSGVPTDLRRMATSFAIGPLKLRTETYFAITSNSLQAGYAIELKADIDVASIDGRLQVDVLLYLEPRFHFLASLTFNVTLRAFGKRLAAVTVRLTLEGPGAWRAAGYFSFSILWWDVEIDFDERWGNAPEVAGTTTSAVQAVTAELGDRSRVLPGPPLGGSAIATLAPAESGLLLAHPCGQLTIAQKSVPFDVEIDRMGTQRLTEGKVRFTIDEVRVGGRATASREPATEHFARGQFMELSDAERIAVRSFEIFTSGVRVGASAYTVGGVGTTVTADYEVEVLEPAPVLNMWWTVTERYVETLGAGLAMQLAHHGAAAHSSLAIARSLRFDIGKVLVQPVPLAIVNPITLTEQTAGAASVTSMTIASQAAAASGGIVVEAFEAVT